MKNQETENTIKEILEEDKLEVKKKKRKGSCFLRLLIILTILFICVFGFILVRQKMLDLEAQAIIFARQTAYPAETQVNVDEKGVETDVQSAVEAASPLAEATPIPVTATPDKMTATLAAQLTSVAEFQLSRTLQP